LPSIRRRRGVRRLNGPPPSSQTELGY
jgi:hypothetical protein